MCTQKEAESAKQFWLSDDAGDTVNYPWEAAADYASVQRETILSAIADQRDYHLRHAQDWLGLVAKYAQDENLKDLADASCAANRHNFAAHSLAMVLKDLEAPVVAPGKPTSKDCLPVGATQ